MKTFEECQKHEKYSKIKKSTIDTINDYVKLGLTPGGFVKAVLSNDLMRSFGLADDENRESLFEICSYVYNEVPSSCHGSDKKSMSGLNL